MRRRTQHHHLVAETEYKPEKVSIRLNNILSKTTTALDHGPFVKIWKNRQIIHSHEFKFLKVQKILVEILQILEEYGR